MIQAFLTCALIFSGLAQTGDPVVMTVGNTDVRLSELRYQYGKSAAMSPVSTNPAKFLEMFGIMKMKVEDAKSAGCDTTLVFRDEMNRQKRRLSEPMIVDSVMLNRFIEESFGWSKEEVEAYCIVKRKTTEPWLNSRLKTKLDSIAEIVADGADFTDFAANCSDDKETSSLGGYMGYVRAGTKRYDFERLLFNARPNEVCGVFDTPAAYYLVKAGNRRKAAVTPDSLEFRRDIIASCCHPDDSRTHLIKNGFSSRLAKKHNASVNQGTVMELHTMLTMTGSDSLFRERIEKNDIACRELISMSGRSIDVAEFIREFPLSDIPDPAFSLYAFDRSLQDFFLLKLVEKEEEWLYANDAGFRNLMNEYADGHLLFEISTKRVWSHPEKSQQRLEREWIKELKRKFPVKLKVSNLDKLLCEN